MTRLRTRHNINERATSIDTPTKIHEEQWSKLVMLAKVCYIHNPEADLYFLFDTYRTKVLGGWEYTEEFKAQVDADIAKEGKRRGYQRTV